MNQTPVEDALNHSRILAFQAVRKLVLVSLLSTSWTRYESERFTGTKQFSHSLFHEDDRGAQQRRRQSGFSMIGRRLLIEVWRLKDSTPPQINDAAHENRLNLLGG